MTFLLPASVTQENVLRLEKEGLLNLTTVKTVDCSALSDFDSTVITVMLAWQKKLQADGQQLKIVRAPEKLKVLASVYGVSTLLGLS